MSKWRFAGAYPGLLRVPVTDSETISIGGVNPGLHVVGWMFTFAAAAYNLVRMRNLMAKPVGAA